MFSTTKLARDLRVIRAVPTLQEISNDLTDRFIYAENKTHAATDIVVEINSLEHVDSKKPIEYELKASIINVIESNLSTHSKESMAFAKLKSHILSKLDTMNEKRKVSVNLTESLEMLKHQVEKYFHK